MPDIKVLVVDDSIVVIDNMYRKHMEKPSGDGRVSQLVSGASEMVPAILSSTATTIAVFLPISIIGGMIGSAFSGFAWSVAIALAASLFVSMIIVPILANLLWRKHPVKNSEKIETSSRKILKIVFQKKKMVIILVVALLAITITEAVRLPVNFFPRSNAGNVAVQIELPEKSTLTDVDAEVKNAETILKNKREVATFSSTLGSSFSPMFDDVFDEGGGWVQKQNVANISVELKKGTDTDLFIKNLRRQMTALSATAVYTISNQNISGDDSRLKIILNGSNQNELTAAAILVRSKLQMIPGLSVEGTANDADTPMKYYLLLNQEKVNSLGINTDEVLNRIQSYYSEDITLNVPATKLNVPIVLRTEQKKSLVTADDPNPEKTILSALGHEKFIAKDGNIVTLAEFSSLTMSAQSVISEREGKPFAAVTGNIVSKDISGVTKQVKATMKALILPNGVEYSIGGISKQIKQMVMEMSLALALSIILVLLIVSSVFRG
jgi:multidrug efflux pump subunit AcrB